MKPRVVMHMGISIDGRIVPTSWPKAVSAQLGETYERIHRDLKGDAWIVGRITMAEFGKGAPVPVDTPELFPRDTWKAEGAMGGPYAIALDQSGKLHLNTNRANGDHIVAILTESVSDMHIAELRRDGISYVFAGKTELDLSLALSKLENEFQIKHLLLEGGGGVNGSFLSGGLVDEVSLLIAPIADGSDGPTLFTRGAPLGTLLKLVAVDRLEADFIHLRYEVVSTHN